MDGPRFDLWTRRRFGLAAGVIAASPIAVPGLTGTEASKRKKKRKRRRKRCKRLGDICQQSGKRKCCGDLRCDNHGTNSIGQTFCCKIAGKQCSDELDCCAGLFCCVGVTTELACRAVCP
jgi:hypothetical protein